MHRYWANVDVCRKIYSMRNLPSPSLGIFSLSRRSKNEMSIQAYAISIKRVVELSFFQMTTRLGNLDFTAWRIELQSCNRQSPLKDEDCFLVWEHIIRVEYSPAQEFDKKRAIERCWCKNADRTWYERYRKDNSVFGGRASKKLLPKACIPTAPTLKAAKLRCHVLLIPESYHTLVAEDPSKPSEYARFRLAIIALNHPKVPLRSDVEDAYKAVLKARVSAMPSSTLWLHEKISHRCQKQVCSLNQ